MDDVCFIGKKITHKYCDSDQFGCSARSGSVEVWDFRLLLQKMKRSHLSVLFCFDFYDGFLFGDWFMSGLFTILAVSDTVLIWF